MIDTHAHINFPELQSDIAGVLERAHQAGVEQIIIPGTSFEYNTSSVKLSTQYPGLFSAIGIHPHQAEEYTDSQRNVLLEYLEKYDKIVSIGEVGLDYFRLENNNERERELQKEVFKEFVDLARNRMLPLIVHTREAFADTYAILAENAPGHPTVLHCFTGSREQAQKWLDLGCFLSLTGIITYRKNQELRDTVKEVPLDRVMLETDAPFLAPEDYRSEICEPRHLIEVARCLADIHQKSLEEIDSITTTNAKKFFRLKG